MTDLEILKKVRNEKYQLAEIAQNRAKEGYEGLIRNALEKNNFNMDLVYRLVSDISSREPDDRWCKDLVQVGIKDGDKYYDLDIYIKSDKVEFNNCCSGNWSINTLYYQYIKLMDIIATEVSESLLTYSKSINRQPLKDADQAYSNVEREVSRIRQEEYDKQRQARIDELNGAAYIGHYKKLRSWEDGYVEGEDKFKRDALYKVEKITPKYFIVREYWNGGWSYCNDRLKKEQLYSLSNNYRAVNENELNISD